MPRTSVPIAFVVQAFLVACAAAPPPPSKPEPPPPGPLARNVRPLHYTLGLRVDPDQPRFSGTAEIAIELDQPRDQLWMHGRGLHITEASADGSPARFEQVTDDGVASLSLPRALGPGRATLRFAWDAPFDPQLVGLYVAKEAGLNYAFTQFEAIDARKAFPCFDDPAFKTPFDVTLTVPAADIAVANTSELEQKQEPSGFKSIRFATTLPLPTYLLAWSIGPFDVVTPPPLPPNPIRKRPLQVRGIAAKGRGAELSIALEAGAALLIELEKWFGSEFPYDKLDHIAVPDYNYGAMENAGAITYRETFILFNATTGGAEQKANIADGLAHEMAHQWFGDLVTLRWWNDAWLNESFATWMATKTVERAYPAFLPGIDRLKRTGVAMIIDSRVASRSIRQPVETNAEIGDAFASSIAYDKGAAVLGMFERFAGADKFQEGVRRYIEVHRNGSGSTDELLASLSQAAGRDVAGPFRTFLDQPGVPLVEARVDCEKVPQLRLKQSRFLPVGSQGDRARTWQIPFCARYAVQGAEKESCALLAEREGAVALEGCPDFVVPNADAGGYYRWSLASADLARLRKAPLTLRERISLGQNLRAAVQSADLRASDALRALEPLARDREGPVASEPMHLIRAVDRYLSDDIRPAERGYAANLYREAYRRLGWEARPGETHADKIFRREVIELLVGFSRDEEATAEGARRGKLALGDPRAVDPELTFAALAQYVRSSGASAFDALLARLEKTEDAEDRERILGALGSTLDPALSRRALALGLDPRLRKNERTIALSVQLLQRETREAAWQWLRENFDELVKLIPEFHASGLPLAVVFCDAAHLAQMESFFAPRVEKIPSAPRSLQLALERTRLCIAESNAQRADAESFFRQLAKVGESSQVQPANPRR